MDDFRRHGQGSEDKIISSDCFQALKKVLDVLGADEDENFQE